MSSFYFSKHKNNFIERTSARVRAASKMAGGQEMCLRYRQDR